MNNTIKIKGRICFDPINRTKKHQKQSEWKKVAIINFNCEIIEYYNWFLKKRYNLTLNKPLRGAHVTFINDRTEEMGGKWKEVKERWDNREIEVVINIDPKTDSDDENSKGHWWMNIPEKDRKELFLIRNELGLGRPYWGLHMTLGHANEKNIDHSKYIHRLIKRGIIRD